MQRNKYKKKSGRQSRCWLVKPWPERLPRRLNLALQQLHRETEETEKEKKINECICILLWPYIAYTDIWYTHPQALMFHRIPYTVCASHIFVSTCLDSYSVCMCISHAYVCHYPTLQLSVCAVTQHTARQSMSNASAL